MRIFRFLIWPLFIGSCLGAVLAARALKWPPSQDPLHELRQHAATISRLLPADSPVALRLVGLPEDYFNHLRYAVIPRPLEMRMPQARRVILLCSDSAASAAADRLLYERPDLRPDTALQGQGFRLALYKPTR